MEKVALWGAAGAIGHSIASALRERGQPYRVVGRQQETLEAAFGEDPLAEIATWDPEDEDSIEEAARGVDTIVYLVGVPYHRFELHPHLMERTITGATDAEVKRILLIGTVYPYGKPQTRPVTEQHPRNPQTYKGKKRKEQEDLLLRAHAEGRIQGAVLRLPDFYGPHVERSFLDSLFKAAANGGTANMLGPIDTPHEFVFVPDVGPVVADLIRKDAAYGKWWNLAGAGSLSQKEIVNRVSKMAGHEVKVRVAGKMTLRIFGLFSPLMRELVEMNYLLTDPVILDDSALRDLLGTVKKTSYEEGLRESLEAAQQSLKASAAGSSA